MIAEQLDGRRIAITGGTGFLGTALIERLLRCVPGCQLVLLIRPGRRSTVEQRAKREIFGNNAFDRLRQELGRDAFEQMVEDRVTPIAGDVGTDGLALDDAGRGGAGVLRHRHPLRRHRVVRLAARRGRRGEPARAEPHRRDAPRPRRGTPPRVGVHLLRGRQPTRGGAGDPRRTRARSSSTSTGAARCGAPAERAPTRRRTAVVPRRWSASARRLATRSAPPASPPSPPRPNSDEARG